MTCLVDGFILISSMNYLLMGHVSLGLEGICLNALTEWSAMKIGFRNLLAAQYYICQNSLLITVLCLSASTKMTGDNQVTDLSVFLQHGSLICPLTILWQSHRTIKCLTPMWSAILLTKLQFGTMIILGIYSVVKAGY